MRSLQRATCNPWVSIGAQVAVLEFLMVGVTALVAASHPVAHALDGLGYALLALAAGSVGMSRGWPLSAFCVCLGATLAYYGLGYPSDGPIYAGVLVTLYAAVLPDNPTRSVIVGAVALVSFFTVRGAGVGGGSFPAWVAAALVLGHAVGNRRAYRAAVEDRAQQAEQTREEHAQRRVAEERLRIARELHDVLSHTISVINVQAGVAAHLADERAGQSREALVVIKTASKQALQELRGLLGVLRQADDLDPRAPAPGLSQLDGLVESYRLVGLPARLLVEGEARPLPPAVDLAAFRIVQESLTNALRHAGSASVQVAIAYEDNRVLIEATDDGTGCLHRRRARVWAWWGCASGLRPSAATSRWAIGQRAAFECEPLCRYRHDSRPAGG
jgi:signal transduction histidine kinase